VRDVRHGEHLWVHWEGEGFDYDDTTETTYFTFGHVDLENDVVRRALASALQRDGLADSLSDGFLLIDSARAHCAFAGLLPGERDHTICDRFGETDYGDQVEDALEVSWVTITF